MNKCRKYLTNYNKTVPVNASQSLILPLKVNDDFNSLNNQPSSQIDIYICFMVAYNKQRQDHFVALMLYMERTL